MDGNRDAGRSDSCISCQRIPVVEKTASEYVLIPPLVKLSSVVSPFNSSAKSPKHTWDREPSFDVRVCVRKSAQTLSFWCLDLMREAHGLLKTVLWGVGGRGDCDDR